MPKVAQTFKQRAIDFAMTATPQETEEIVVLMKQIAKNRGSVDNGASKPTGRAPRIAWKPVKKAGKDRVLAEAYLPVESLTPDAEVDPPMNRSQDDVHE